jgi:hypothetical protein
MKNLLAVAFGLSLLGGTLSGAQAQGTSGSTDSHAHATKGGHRLAPQSHARGGHKKGGKKGKKSSGGSTTQPPK